MGGTVEIDELKYDGGGTVEGYLCLDCEKEFDRDEFDIDEECCVECVEQKQEKELTDKFNVSRETLADDLTDDRLMQANLAELFYNVKTAYTQKTIDANYKELERIVNNYYESIEV